MLTDLVENGQEFIVARGGRGGRGNIRFATPKNPAPEISENGEPGQERELLLELKVLADVVWSDSHLSGNPLCLVLLQQPSLRLVPIISRQSCPI